MKISYAKKVRKKRTERFKGLRGGVGVGRTSKTKSSGPLRLRNRGTDCFVNATIKLVLHTNLPNYLRAELTNWRDNEELTVSHQIRKLNQSRGTQLTNHIRTEVANISQMQYLDQNEQEDALEFLMALNTSLQTELGWSEWEGETKTENQFKTPTGACEKCSEKPPIVREPFLALKVGLPNVDRVALSKVIQDNLREDVYVKCSFCCPHEKEGKACDQVGDCRKKATINISLIKSPEYLFIQLKRYRYYEGVIEKSLTHVTFNSDEELQISNSRYTIEGVTSHQGPNTNIGHYFTHLRSKGRQNSWTLHDDEVISTATFKNVNTNENYILLAKRVDNEETETLQNLNDMLIMDICGHEEKSEGVKECAVSSGEGVVDELDVEIERLEKKENKSPEEKKELRKLKMRRNKRNQRKRDVEKETETEREERLRLNREQVKKSRSTKNERSQGEPVVEYESL